MKKKIAFVMLLLMMVSSGCGNPKETGAESAVSTAQQSEPAAVSQQPSEEESSEESEEEESVYISEDPFEYVRYLGQWTDYDKQDVVLEITTKDDVNFTVKVSLFEKSGEWTGVFEKENGGIHYEGSLGGLVCEGYIRVNEEGIMKLKSLSGVSGKDLQLRRTDT